MRGRATFDYASNNGVCIIGSGDLLFETKWSQRSGNSIYVSLNLPSIHGVALATGASEIAEIKDASRFDFSSRNRSPTKGQIAIVRNAHDRFAAIKILDVKSSSHGDQIDQLSIDYVVLEDGGRDFSDIKEVQVVDSSFSKRALLIGAGFSKNWGGYLASEVGGRLIAHPRVIARPALRSLILREDSFEDALEKTRTGLFETADAEAMETAVKDTFEQMDGDYKNPNPAVLGATINDFISRFCPGAVGIGTGYVFSLNQDLLLERVYGTQPARQQLTIPGIVWQDRPPPFPAGGEPIPLASIVDPSVNEPQLLKNFNQIKLHGSINWRASDGTSSMIMGRRKPLTISKSPLIGWYHRVLESVLSSGDVRLMVIGYGWGDEHINDPIAEAIEKHRLQVYLWDLANPKDLLANKHKSEIILKGVMGYTARSMREVMPNTPMNSGSAHYDALLKDFF